MAEVKLTMSAQEHQILLALLRYLAKKLTGEQMNAILVSVGYRGTVPLEEQLSYIADQLSAAIR